MLTAAVNHALPAAAICEQEGVRRLAQGHLIFFQEEARGEGSTSGNPPVAR